MHNGFDICHFERGLDVEFCYVNVDFSHHRGQRLSCFTNSRNYFFQFFRPSFKHYFGHFCAIETPKSISKSNNMTTADTKNAFWKKKSNNVQNDLNMFSCVLKYP